MTRSGSVCPNIEAKFQPCSFGHSFGFGMSLTSPFGAPASTHFTMVATCSSLSERSFLKCWMPTDLSMFHGGIWCDSTRVLIERAQGRDSSNVTRDIGAIDSGRWQASHFSWKIGAMSLVKVGLAGTAADETAGASAPAAKVKART